MLHRRWIVVLFLNFRFPFDWTNPYGYFMAFILIYVTQLNWIFFVKCCLCFGIGVYMFIIALTKDIKTNLTAFSAMVQTEPNPVLLYKELFDLVQFHSRVKRFRLQWEYTVRHSNTQLKLFVRFAGWFAVFREFFSQFS